MLRMLFRKLHREFLTIDNYEEYQTQKPRNWPLIIGFTGLLFGGYLYYQYNVDFWRWVYTGYNGWALGLTAVLFLVVFFYQRNREEKKLQQRGAA